MDTQGAKELIEKYTRAECTAEERALVETWFLKALDEAEADFSSPDYSSKEKEIYARLPSAAPLKVQLWKRIAVAASIVIGLTAALYFYAVRTATNNSSQLAMREIPAGKSGATLTLANGRKIVLSSAANGELAKEAGVSISKTANGQLIYTVTEKSNSSLQFNTLSTAKGQTYQIILPDQSVVWLNAASTLKYSSSFVSAKSRIVQLSGEAYFEIAKVYSTDKGRLPFIVQTKKQTVEVLGTHFNVNAYDDELNTKTTLLEGRVKIQAPGKQGLAKGLILKPGQEAASDGQRTKVSAAETDAAIGWKNGDFVFNGEDFKSAMKKIARWYDIEVVYESQEDADIQLDGWVSRKSNLSIVLKRIESTGKVHFKIEGRRLIVTE